MSTRTITLSDNRLAKLREIADRFHINPEDLAPISIEELLTRPGESFQQAVYILNKSRTLSASRVVRYRLSEVLELPRRVIGQSGGALGVLNLGALEWERQTEVSSADANSDFKPDDHRFVGEIFQTLRNRWKRRCSLDRIDGAGVESRIRRIQDFRQSQLARAIKNEAHCDLLNSGDVVGIFPYRFHSSLKLL